MGWKYFWNAVRVDVCYSFGMLRNAEKVLRPKVIHFFEEHEEEFRVVEIGAGSALISTEGEKKLEKKSQA